MNYLQQQGVEYEQGLSVIKDVHLLANLSCGVFTDPVSCA